MTTAKNEYIGDGKFQSLLDHYECPTPLSVVKMKFIGAISSPNLDLRPADVISSFWSKGSEPRLQTKEEADLFFKFFMGLWDKLFEEVKENKLELSKPEFKTKEALHALCLLRYDEVEYGFIEGFWGGKEDLNIPAYIAKMVDSLTDLANVYTALAAKLQTSKKLEDELANKFIYTDKMVKKAIIFIIENYVQPRLFSIVENIN